MRPVPTRRGVLGGMAAGLLAGCVSPISTSTARRPLGLAPITVRKELAQDYPGTLRKVAALGYTHFGFPLAQMSPQMPAGPSPAEIARMVRDAGMEVGVVRYGFAIDADEQFAAAAEIGASIVAYSAAPVFFRGGKLGEATREAFDQWLPEFETLAAQAKSAGLRLAYHNHWWDHIPLEGETPLDIIARTFPPSLVAFEIDLAWTKLGGEDPLTLVEKFGARVVAMHFKDVDPSRGEDMFAQLCAPGEGSLGYGTLVPALDRLTTAVGYIEVDNPPDGIAAAAIGARTVLDARTNAHG